MADRSNHGVLLVMILYCQFLITFICLAMLLSGIANGAAVRRDGRLARRTPVPSPAPLISVCIPARNEARNIAACTESLARQHYPNFEVLVLDDCSGDGTGDLARVVAKRHPNVRVLTGEPLAPGWIGKAHACQQLGREARGEWLLFTDADVLFAPRALEWALRLALARRSDLLSALPRMRVETFWERLSVPLVAVTGAGAISFALMTRLKAPWYGAASGAFLFFRRVAYEAIGGHQAVKDRIVEDIGLARAVKRAGGRLVLTGGGRWVACRMYTSLREVWEGLTKNFYALAPGPLCALAVAGLLGVYAWPWFSYLCGPALGWGAWEATILPLVQIGSIALLRAGVDYGAGELSLRGLLLTPLAGIFLSLIALRSASRALLRQPTAWRARQYELWRR